MSSRINEAGHRLIDKLNKQLADSKGEIDVLNHIIADKWQTKVADLEKELAAKDATICGMREIQADIRRSLSCSFSPDDRRKWLAYVDGLFASSPTCPYKEEAELYKSLYVDVQEVYALSVKKENELQAQLAAMVARGQELRKKSSL